MQERDPKQVTLYYDAVNYIFIRKSSKQRKESTYFFDIPKQQQKTPRAETPFFFACFLPSDRSDLLPDVHAEKLDFVGMPAWITL